MQDTNKTIGWSCTEEIGIGIPNPGSVTKFSGAPDVLDRIQAFFEERGIYVLRRPEYLALTYSPS